MELHLLNILIPLFVLLPNFLYVVIKPSQPIPTVHVDLFFVICEKVGQVGMVVLPLFYTVNFRHPLLIIMVIVLAFYYYAWLRYFRTRRVKSLYEPLFYLPIPLAVLPILYFLCSALLIGNPLVYIAWLLLAAGHITITYRHYVVVKNI